MNLLILFVYFIVTVFLQYFNMCNIRMFWFLVAQSVCDAIHTVFCHFSEVLPLCFLLIDNLKAPPSVSGWVTRTFLLSNPSSSMLFHWSMVSFLFFSFLTPPDTMTLPSLSLRSTTTRELYNQTHLIFYYLSKYCKKYTLTVNINNTYEIILSISILT